MRVFRLAFSGDLLDIDGYVNYDAAGLTTLKESPLIEMSFLRDLGPSHDDPTYWDRYYSLLVTPQHIKGINGLYIIRPWIKPSTFVEGTDDLTIIGRAGAGYDKIDVEACTDNNVALFNAPGALSHGTASSALLLMLALSKNLLKQEQIARTARWDLQGSVKGHEIQHKTLGIVGLGYSGRELARLVAPFKMRVIAYSPHVDPAQAAELGVTLVSLDEVFRESDYVSLHSSLRPDTRSMIHREHLALMKPSAYFVNVARGELVDQHALVEMLRDHRIAGAGLDVFEEEPLPADDPLIELDNVILTPHWLPATVEAGGEIGTSVSHGILQAAHGEIPDNVINTAVLDRPEFKSKLARFKENAG